MPDNDAQLELKKRARRRLVGAAALALAAAIFLPMIMDKAPRPAGNELQIRIPSQEGGNYAARLITAKPEALPPVLEPVAEAPTPAQDTPAVPAPVAQAPAAAAKPAVTAPVDEAARARAILEGRPLPAAGPDRTQLAAAATSQAERKPDTKPASMPLAAGSFYVQLGVYREQENVRSVQSRLKPTGFKALTEKVGDRTRVRVGPFPTRQSADAAVLKLKKAGLAGVVAPAR